MIRRVLSKTICAHFIYIWIKKIVDPDGLSFFLRDSSEAIGVNRVNSSLLARIQDRSPSGRAPLDDARYFKNFTDG